MNASLRRGILASVLAGIALVAGAQTDRSGGDAARMTQQLQQLASDRTRLQAENEKLKRDVESAKKELEAARAEGAALGRRASGAEGRRAAAETRGADADQALARSREQLAELVARFRETTETLRQVESERTTQEGRATRLSTDLGACRATSVKLADIANAALDRYENKGVWNAILEREPVTRLQRIEVQNLVDDYREQIKDLAATPATPAQPPGG